MTFVMDGSKENHAIVTWVRKVLDLDREAVQKMTAQRFNYHPAHFYGEVGLKVKWRDQDKYLKLLDEHRKTLPNEVAGLTITSVNKGMDPGFIHVSWNWKIEEE